MCFQKQSVVFNTKHVYESLYVDRNVSYEPHIARREDERKEEEELWSELFVPGGQRTRELIMNEMMILTSLFSITVREDRPRAHALCLFPRPRSSIRPMLMTYVHNIRIIFIYCAFLFLFSFYFYFF